VNFEVKVPAAGESVTEAIIGEWVKKNGEYVERDEVLVVLETDKASMDLVAEQAGKVITKAEEGDTVKVGSVIAVIDTTAQAPQKSKPDPKTAAPSKPAPAPAPAASAPQMAAAPVRNGHGTGPAAKRILGEKGLSTADVKTASGPKGNITKADALETVASHSSPRLEAPPQSRVRETTPQQGDVERVPMTTIRRRISERLVQAQQTAAILTTFNEVDMSAVMALRNQYKDSFEKKYGIKLGFMGIFVKAVIEGLKEFRAINASIEGNDILYYNYYNIGVAVSTPKGLMVPVIKDADHLSVAEIEQEIKNYSIKARDGKIGIDDLSGGTFTISNGGVFGSLMSTPILNPPQTGILGMHKIQERPVVVDGQIVIRPMMYLALSYDHRLVDGRESVSFLVRVKECIEDPQRILLEI
jgi:2-oxoglutarate dehydrogenase E2 component (dihydrolipoamide succinyltransferase)